MRFPALPEDPLLATSDSVDAMFARICRRGAELQVLARETLSAIEELQDELEPGLVVCPDCDGEPFQLCGGHMTRGGRCPDCFCARCGGEGTVER